MICHLSLLFKWILYGAPCERWVSAVAPCHRLRSEAQGKLRNQWYKQENKSLFPWLKTFNRQFPIFASCESTLSHTFLKFMTCTRKWISSTLASHKCYDLSLEMESSVTHKKNSLSSSANRENIFRGNCCKMPVRSTPQGWSLSRFARCSHECMRWLRFPKDQQSFIKVRKFLFLTGLEDSPDQVRLESQTNLNPVCTQTDSQAEVAGFVPKNFINFIFSWCQWSVFSSFPGTKSPELMMDQG